MRKLTNVVSLVQLHKKVALAFLKVMTLITKPRSSVCQLQGPKSKNTCHLQMIGLSCNMRKPENVARPVRLQNFLLLLHERHLDHKTQIKCMSTSRPKIQSTYFKPQLVKGKTLLQIKHVNQPKLVHSFKFHFLNDKGRFKLQVTKY